MKLSEGPVTNDVIQTFLANTSISSVHNLHVFSSQAVAYHHSQEQPLVFDINNAITKSNKPKKDKVRPFNDLSEGAVYKILAERPSRSKVRLMQKGEFLHNITLNMAWFHYHVSHIEFYTSCPSGDHDKDEEDKVLPCLIGHFQDDDDAVSNDPTTIVFLNNNDIQDSPHENLMLLSHPYIW